MTSRASCGYAYMDPRARYFVYYLLDADGSPLYIGRSCNVRGRIQNHATDALDQDDERKARKALWLIDVRSVDMAGPFMWKDAVEIERQEIECLRPVGNIALTHRAPGARRLAVVA